MSKFVILLCIAFLAVGLVVAQETPVCKPGGRICSSDSECCIGLICNPWAGRCTKPKTTTTTSTTASSVPTAPASSTDAAASSEATSATSVEEQQ